MSRIIGEGLHPQFGMTVHILGDHQPNFRFLSTVGNGPDDGVTARWRTEIFDRESVSAKAIANLIHQSLHRCRLSIPRNEQGAITTPLSTGPLGRPNG